MLKSIFGALLHIFEKEGAFNDKGEKPV